MSGAVAEALGNCASGQTILLVIKKRRGFGPLVQLTKNKSQNEKILAKPPAIFVPTNRFVNTVAIPKSAVCPQLVILS
jgi:hypothetical protein